MKIGMLSSTISGSTIYALRKLSSAASFNLSVNNHQISFSASNVPKNLIYLLNQATKLSQATIATIASLMSAGVLAANKEIYLSDQTQTNDYHIINYLSEIIDTDTIQPGICNTNTTVLRPDVYKVIQGWFLPSKPGMYPIDALSLSRGVGQIGDSVVEDCLNQALQAAYDKMQDKTDADIFDSLKIFGEICAGILGICVATCASIMVYKYSKQRCEDAKDEKIRLSRQNHKSTYNSLESGSNFTTFKPVDSIQSEEKVDSAPTKNCKIM